jgi:hydroxymethylpyrimidine pyrophosphatase-like HAD family hydrolase
MPRNTHIKKSPKGFIAIDLDGMTLVEKIDKHFFYGWRNPASHIRQSLIEYIRVAQEKGYDIIILTARPILVEHFLIPSIGTKSTKNIISILKEHGIKIRSIERSGTRNLKGNKMLEILERYKNEGARDAIGILLEDQLKQINHVRSKKNNHLLAYDINHKKDLLEFLSHMSLQDEDKYPFHPEDIIRQVLTPETILKNKGVLRSREARQLNVVQSALKQVNSEAYPKEVQLIQELIDDLCIRLYEAQYRNYTPEIQWVFRATNTLLSLVNHLLDTPNEISHQVIQTACLAFFGVKKIKKAIPNSGCEVLAKELLTHLTIIPFIEDLKKTCTGFQNHLIKHGSLDTVGLEQLQVVQQLNDILDVTKNPLLALQTFSLLIKEKEAIFTQSSAGKGLLHKIRIIMTKIPYLGELFKTHSERFVTDLSGAKEFRFFSEVSLLNESKKPLNSTIIPKLCE